ncbi:hypothetical protein [Pseudoalteromonas luteoviolacea]|uniref:Uncharacterized protein n=1 Tax=Pseudoalteromonas luteoviolacea DSM 6061 TaxID=1365250 RepID=A0A166UZL9_9GAMM|nr:hypothetical protein [Pseudoalteromonas luteoviolacea]KZN31548.1 hypothetical protein N475_23695 [Pseudoalteromonas luteoviolacea DSM 6061]KZN55886.1 hypothetical protein N474_13380 [Pseudoalteromonas luteoviolacea CPMOR-2]MBE0388210.1 hypothetical protein [Pseudoalteromonas luteoviolacea DSM 6061]
MTLIMKKKNIKNLSLNQHLDADKTAKVAAGAAHAKFNDFSKGQVTCKTQ